MFKFKRFLLATLCLAMLASAALPAFAATGYEVHDENLTYIGVRARCTSSLTLIKATGTLSLSYLPAYSYNYLPEDDYVCSVGLTLKYSDGGSMILSPVNTIGMQASRTAKHSGYEGGIYPCTKATYDYHVNGADIYDVTFQ